MLILNIEYEQPVTAADGCMCTDRQRASWMDQDKTVTLEQVRRRRRREADANAMYLHEEESYCKLRW